MFLRWMVRSDNKGVDFGIWKNISPAQLVCPIDVHVARVARHFQLLKRKQTDWQAAIELTDHVKEFDKNDPVRYDFALFALGFVAVAALIGSLYALQRVWAVTVDRVADSGHPVVVAVRHGIESVEDLARRPFRRPGPAQPAN